MALRRAVQAGRQRVAAKREARKNMRNKGSDMRDTELVTRTTYHSKPIFGSMVSSRLCDRNALKPDSKPFLSSIDVPAKPTLGSLEPKLKTTGPLRSIWRRRSDPFTKRHPIGFATRDLQLRVKKRWTKQPKDRDSIRSCRWRIRNGSTVHELRRLLGLSSIWSFNQTLRPPEDALIVSVDTECEKRGLNTYVVELGVSLLDTRDIAFEPPGDRAQNWIAKVKTKHWVVDMAHRRLPERINTGLFARSVLASAAQVRSAFLNLLRDGITRSGTQVSSGTAIGTRNIVLVGHSIASDVLNLHRCPGFALDLNGDLFSQSRFRIAKTFDTQELALDAIERGARMISLKLGMLVNWLGVHQRHADGKNVVGTHNAANDAAYTMMALLMLAVRWNKITQSNFKAGPLQEVGDSHERAPSYAGVQRYGDYLQRLLRDVWTLVARRFPKRRFR